MSNIAIHKYDIGDTVVCTYYGDLYNKVGIVLYIDDPYDPIYLVLIGDEKIWMAGECLKLHNE